MDVLAQLEDLVRQAGGEKGCEPRAVFTRVVADGDALRVESSDPELLGQVLTRIRESELAGHVGPVRPVELPVAALRAQRAWVSASVADVRRLPQHAAEQVTQALQGEVLEPLLHENGWLLARLPDGYVGWIRDWHLQLHDPTVPATFAERANARIGVPIARVREAPDDSAAPCAEVILGTRVVAGTHRDGWLEITLPAALHGWVCESEVRSGTQSWPAVAAHILTRLRSFFGVPYVWGGRSPKGFDCSGLVQFVFGLHGVALPRDSDQQFECGHSVREPEPGDLLFFGRDQISHVAVAQNAHEYLHARGHVRTNSLARESPIYDAELASMLRGCRRVLPHDS